MRCLHAGVRHTESPGSEATALASLVAFRMGHRARSRSISRDSRELRVNGRIHIRQVFLIDETNTSIGVIDTDEAMRLARERGLDLVEVSPNQRPPVAKLLDYGKFKYEQNRKEREGRKHQRAGDVKEVRFRPRTDVHDVETKVKRMAKFLEAGAKVKATVRMRGRERIYPELAAQLLNNVVERLGPLAVVERPIVREGNNSFAVILIPGPGTGGGKGD